MKREISPDLLKKYLSGETTQQESAEVDEWYLFLQENPDDISLLDPFELNIIESKILDRIKAGIELPSEIKKPRQAKTISFFSQTPFKIAAAIAAIAIIGFGATRLTQKGLTSVSVEAHVVSHLKKVTNYTSSIKQLLLEDGTVIKLKPNSSIEYPQTFSEFDRKVQLRGEAFFDVTKDKARPFIITTNDVTIKVLGTSFNVVAYEGAKETSVVVKTGKVSVYAKTKGGDANQQTSSEEVILTPNQEVIYHTATEYFSKKLVAQPEIILAKPTLFETQYDGVPVVKILEVLEQNYGIAIQYDEDALSGCILTTSMAEEGLYERIEIICKAIGAQYETTDTMIVIKSNGCR
jgi:ferric-dicitrate binding protein FerR (iron transport regulator)